MLALTTPPLATTGRTGQSGVTTNSAAPTATAPAAAVVESVFKLWGAPLGRGGGRCSDSGPIFARVVDVFVIAPGDDCHQTVVGVVGVTELGVGWYGVVTLSSWIGVDVPDVLGLTALEEVHDEVGGRGTMLRMPVGYNCTLLFHHSMV